MFSNQSRETAQAGSVETLIGPSVKLEGNFSGEGDVVVEGFLIGNLTTKGDVRVGPQAQIEAEIKAKNATIAGRVKGNLTLTSLSLTSTATITGDIKTASLSVEEGAVINGKVMMGKEKPNREHAPLEAATDKAKPS